MSSTEQDRRFQQLLALLQRILDTVTRIEADVDQLDRNQRPFGDGTKTRKGRR